VATLAEAITVALEHHRAGRLVEAATLYRRILAAAPDHADSLHLLGLIAHQRGHDEDAVRDITQAVALNPTAASFYGNLGEAFRGLGRKRDAFAQYRRAVQLEPEYPEAHSNLALLLHQAGRPDDAAARYETAVALRPGHAETYYNFAVALQQNDRAAASLALYRRALRIAPGLAEAHRHLGIALRELGRTDDALGHFREAVRLRPDSIEARNSLGLALQDKGNLDEAEGHFDAAIRLKPDHRLAYFHKSLIQLVRGEYRAGWQNYEARWHVGVLRPPSGLRQPIWTGQDPVGKTILLHSEQGWGDSIQFCRYAPLLARRGARVLLGVRAPLTALMRSLDGPVTVIEDGASLPPYDYHCSMLSLPHLFATELETIPAQIPYLAADPDKVRDWAALLDGSRGLKVGLVWAGGARQEFSGLLQAMDRRRSITLAQLAPLAAIPNVTFVSLQKGEASVQAGGAPAGLTIHDFTARLDSFADTAALVQNLDLVISVDTAVAHLAGALGKPVWLLNRFDTCWRWLLGRSDSPWYPSMRLFRQDQPGEWAPVIDRMADALAILANHRHG
jgi:tetratricopeptide (TPR) repeat protein